MKSKDQKRREAIERLERQPRWNGRTPEPNGWAQAKWSKRLEDAARLRRAFGFARTSSGESHG